ncbi:MAG: fatty acid desaturase family protein [Candidatus Binatia bacterium]
MSANQEFVAYANRGRGIPVWINLTLGCFYIAINFYQFIYLPLRFLPIGMSWAWTLAPLALLTNPFWSLIHEAIHDLFHPDRVVNTFFGRFLSILFGAPFGILRLSHLLHHKLNRLPIEGTEFYDRAKSTKARAAPGYYFQISLGLYLFELLSPFYFFLPRRLLAAIQKRFFRPDSVSGLLMQNWLGAESLREIRFDGLLILVWLTLSFLCYGERWPLLAALLLARGFLISFLDNIFHYATPVGNIFYAKNLRLPQPLAKLWLNFNLHGIHHVNPAISWIDLPAAFDAEAAKYEGGYFEAARRQLRGPGALQDLPQDAPALRLRPF